MEEKYSGIINIIIGVLQIIYLLMYNGIIRINAFIVNYSYTNSFRFFMIVYKWTLAIIILMLVITAIKTYIKRKKEKLNNIGYFLIITSHIIFEILFLLRLASIFSISLFFIIRGPLLNKVAIIIAILSIIGGFIILLEKRKIY